MYVKNSVAKHIINNKSNVLLYGTDFQNKLLNSKGGKYFKTFFCNRFYKL